METKITKTKIERAIYDTELRLKDIEQNLMLLSRERDVLAKQLNTLNIINNTKELDD